MYLANRLNRRILYDEYEDSGECDDDDDDDRIGMFV